MADASSVISVAIVGDSKKFTRAVGQADKAVGGFGSSVKGFAIGVGTALAGLFAIRQAFDFLGDSLEEADRLANATDNLNRIIGEVNAKKIEDVADDFLKLGLSSQDVLELSVGFARIGKALGIKPRAMGIYADDVAAVAKALSLADEKGRDAAVWVEAIAKAASKANNVRALGVLGIKLSEARVIREALRKTGKESADELTKGQLAAARMRIILQKLGPEVTKALTDPSLAQKQEEIQARIKELQANIGQGLAPIVKDLLTNLTDIAESEWVDSMLKGVDVVRAAIPGLITDFSEGWAIVQKAIQPVTDQLNGIPEDLQQIADGAATLAADMAKAFEQMAADVGELLAPLARIQDMINQIIGGDHTVRFTVVEGGTRAPRNSPGGGSSERTQQRTASNWQQRNGELP